MKPVAICFGTIYISQAHWHENRAWFLGSYKFQRTPILQVFGGFVVGLAVQFQHSHLSSYHLYLCCLHGVTVYHANQCGLMLLKKKTVLAKLWISCTWVFFPLWRGLHVPLTFAFSCIGVGVAPLFCISYGIPSDHPPPLQSYPYPLIIAHYSLDTDN
jgi:hypothetical protein